MKQVFLKNQYPLSFIDKCFKMVINKLVIKRPQVTTVEKKTLILSLPYLGDISLQTRTKLRKSFKSILNCYVAVLETQPTTSRICKFAARSVWPDSDTFVVV